MSKIHLVPLALLTLGVPRPLIAQPPSMSQSQSAFLAARLEAGNVVPPSDSSGSGTGVFVFSGKGRESVVSYQLSYATLTSPEVRSITLRNFGAGKEGRVVHVICGQESTPCPKGADGTLRGKWSSQDERLPLTEALWPELANRRIYVEIETARDKEIRSQLGPNPFMAMAQEGMADLKGSGAEESATGTAAIRFVTIREKPELQLLFTVAGAKHDPTKLTLLRRNELLGTFPVPRAEAARPSRTARMVVTSQQLKFLAESTFGKSFSNDELTLVVVLGGQEQTTVRGQVRMVR